MIPGMAYTHKELVEIAREVGACGASGFTGGRLALNILQLAATALSGVTDNPEDREAMKRRIWLTAAGMSYGAESAISTMRDRLPREPADVWISENAWLPKKA